MHVNMQRIPSTDSCIQKVINSVIKLFELPQEIEALLNLPRVPNHHAT